MKPKKLRLIGKLLLFSGVTNIIWLIRLLFLFVPYITTLPVVPYNWPYYWIGWLIACYVMVLLLFYLAGLIYLELKYANQILHPYRDLSEAPICVALLEIGSIVMLNPIPFCIAMINFFLYANREVQDYFKEH